MASQPLTTIFNHSQVLCIHAVLLLPVLPSFLVFSMHDMLFCTILRSAEFFNPSKIAIVTARISVSAVMRLMRLKIVYLSSVSHRQTSKKHSFYDDMNRKEPRKH